MVAIAFLSASLAFMREHWLPICVHQNHQNHCQSSALHMLLVCCTHYAQLPCSKRIAPYRTVRRLFARTVPCKYRERIICCLTATSRQPVTLAVFVNNFSSDYLPLSLTAIRLRSDGAFGQRAVLSHCVCMIYPLGSHWKAHTNHSTIPFESEGIRKGEPC